MGVITPETGAISNFLWVEAQKGMKDILIATSDAQKLINPDYAFTVYSNKYQPVIEDMAETGAMVNIRIGRVESIDSSNFGCTHKVTYFFDCYVRGKNEIDPESQTDALIPADEVAVERLHYLVAMVNNAVLNLANFYKGMSVKGLIVPGDVGIVFNPVKDVENTAEPYAPAQVTFVCKFPYEAEDLKNLPAYEATFIDLGTWAANIFK